MGLNLPDSYSRQRDLKRFLYATVAAVVSIGGGGYLMCNEVISHAPTCNESDGEMVMLSTMDTAL